MQAALKYVFLVLHSLIESILADLEKYMSPRALEYSPADPKLALSHFRSILQFETDCSDVQADLADGTAEFVLLDVRGAARFAKGHVMVRSVCITAI